MYCILMTDVTGKFSIYNIGKNPKLYESEKSAMVDINDMIKKEMELFGNVLTKYEAVRYYEVEE